MADKERMCCVCRVRRVATELIRVARVDGKYLLDKTNGRGCYICPTCIDKAIKTKALNRSFKTNIDSEVYQALAKIKE